MRINAKFEKLTQIPGTSKLVQGVKHGRVPRNAVAGGNGSFIVTERAQLILSVKMENGKTIQKDIYFDVKEHFPRNITRKFCGILQDGMQDFNFIVEDGKITNLDEALTNIKV